MMAKKILLVYPKYPETFWGFKYAIKFISKWRSIPIKKEIIRKR